MERPHIPSADYSSNSYDEELSVAGCKLNIISISPQNYDCGHYCVRLLL